MKGSKKEGREVRDPSIPSPFVSEGSRLQLEIRGGEEYEQQPGHSLSPPDRHVLCLLSIR